MKVYVVLCNDNCYSGSNIQAVFANRKKAERYMVKYATYDMDDCDIEGAYRRCYYNERGDLIQIRDEQSYTCDWWIESEIVKY